MPAPEPIKLIFAQERDTKNKVRFQEVTSVEDGKGGEPVPKGKAVVEKIDMDKKVLKKMGDPDLLHVTISAP